MRARSAEQALEAVRAAYRLTPDRRFVDAFRALPMIVGSGAPGGPAVHAEIVADGWQLVAGSRSLGTVGEFPGFLELFELLRAEADRLVARKGADAAREALTKGLAVDPAEPWLMLLALDRRLADGRYRALDVELASQALVLLLVQMSDEMGVGDVVASQALAAVALA